MSASPLSRLPFVAAMVTALFVYAGCDTTEPAELTTCADLSGTYAATAASFQAPNDPDLVEDFDGASWTIAFSGDQFDSEFITAGDSTIAAEGTFSVTGESQQAPPEIILGNEPLLPDVQAGDQRFSCELEANGFTLETMNLDFDFDGDGTFENAQFDARFVNVAS